MTKPMYCPMSFANSDRVWAWGEDEENGGIKTAFHPIECTPDCAWAVKTDQRQYGCSVA